MYKIPLKFFCNISKVNQCIKFNTKIRLILETEMKKLFETNASNVTYLNVEIIFTDAPFIQYKKTKLDNNFRTYLENSLLPENVLRTGTQKTPYQKTYEINKGSQSPMVAVLINNFHF